MGHRDAIATATARTPAGAWGQSPCRQARNRSGHDLVLAGGFPLAQMCDLCSAAAHARSAITETKVGKGMPWAGPPMHMLPRREAMVLLLVGEPMCAHRALALGFVNDMVPPDRPWPRALEMTGIIAANSPLSVRAVPALDYLAAETGLSATLNAARTLFEPVYFGKDALESQRALTEKRAPRWRGR